LKSGNIRSVKLDGESLNWNVHRIAAGAALAGYYVVMLSRTDQFDEFEHQLVHQNRLALLGESAAMVAHDAVGPLNAIANNAELLLTFSRLDPETRQCLTTILDEADRASSLLQNILRFANGHKAEIRPQNIEELIGESIRLVKQQSSTQQAVCRVEATPNLDRVAGDYAQLLQVFCNVISNAVDASEKDQEIKVIVTNGRFLDGTPAIEIAVVDRGHGMSTGDRERAFDPFFTTKGNGNGTGLGLSIAKRIVEAQHGRIVLESSPRQGTTVTVMLPVFREKPNGSKRIMNT
jgi:signal transduction histidine kinase